MGGEIRPRLVRDKRASHQKTKTSKTGNRRYMSKAQYLAQNTPSAAEKLDPAQSTTMVTPEEGVVPEQRKSLSFSVGASHNSGFYEDSAHTTSLFGSASFKFNKKQSASIAQSFNQSYRVNPGVDDKGFSQNDTVLGFNHELAENFLSARWGAKLTTTLPVSERSNRLDVITVSTISLSASRYFYNNRLSASISPRARYYFSEYTTTPSDPGAGGGNPLPEYLLGATLSLSYSLNDKLSLSGAAGWSTQYYYQTQYVNPDPVYGFTAPPKNSYSLSMGLDYSFTKRWAASFTYAHADRYEKPWGTEYLVFNDRVTTWSVGTSYSF